MRGGPQDGEGRSLGAAVSDTVKNLLNPPPGGERACEPEERKKRDREGLVIRGAAGEGETAEGRGGVLGLWGIKWELEM